MFLCFPRGHLLFNVLLCLVSVSLDRVHVQMLTVCTPFWLADPVITLILNTVPFDVHDNIG